MIGTLLSVHYIGHKNWKLSLVFWIVALVVGAIATSVIAYILPTVSIAGTIVGVAVVLGLLHYWYKFPWEKSIVIWAIALVIDIIIVAILVAILFAAIGLDWLTPYIPTGAQVLLG